MGDESEHKRFRVLLLHYPEQRAISAAQWMEQILAEVDWYETIDFDVYENATNAVLRTQPEVVWVEAVYTISQGINVVEELAASFPETPIVSCSYENQPFWTREAFRVGAWDHVDEKTLFPYLAALRERILHQLEMRSTTTTAPSDTSAPVHAPPLKVLLCREELDIKNNARIDKLMKNEAGRVRVIGRVKQADLLQRAQYKDFDLIWMCTSQASEAVLPLVSQLQNAYPAVRLLVSYFGKDVEVPRALLRLGIQDVLVMHTKYELETSLDELVPRKLKPFTAEIQKQCESGYLLGITAFAACIGLFFATSAGFAFSPMGALYFGIDPGPDWIFWVLGIGLVWFAIFFVIGAIWVRNMVVLNRPWAVFGVKYPFATVPSDARTNRFVRVVVNGLERENSKAFVVPEGVTIEFTRHVDVYAYLRGFTLPWNQVAALDKLGDQAVLTLKDGQIVSLPYRIFERNENVPQGLLPITEP